jgi:uncharacterized membrane protein YqiK
VLAATCQHTALKVLGHQLIRASLQFNIQIHSNLEPKTRVHINQAKSTASVEQEQHEQN